MKLSPKADNLQTGLLRGLASEHLANAGHARLVLDAHDSASPCPRQLLLVLVKLALHRLAQRGKLRLVRLLHVRHGQARRRLLVHHRSQPRLALHDAVRGVHGTAQSRQPHNGLDRLHVVSDHNQLRLLALHKLGHVVQAALREVRLATGRFALGLRTRTQQQKV